MSKPKNNPSWSLCIISIYSTHLSFNLKILCKINSDITDHIHLAFWSRNWSALIDYIFYLDFPLWLITCFLALVFSILVSLLSVFYWKYLLVGRVVMILDGLWMIVLLQPIGTRYFDRDTKLWLNFYLYFLLNLFSKWEFRSFSF